MFGLDPGKPSLEAGTQIPAITETANCTKRSAVYSLVELWLSYADGNVEEALFDPKSQMSTVRLFFAGEGLDERPTSYLQSRSLENRTDSHALS